MSERKDSWFSCTPPTRFLHFLGNQNFKGFNNVYMIFLKSQVWIPELALKYVPNSLIESRKRSSGVVALQGYLAHKETPARRALQ